MSQESSSGDASLGTVVEHPDLYDLLFAEYTSDVEMYQRLSQDDVTLLECGIGTGRIAIPLARAGKSIVGIDNSVQMVSRLHERIAESPDLSGTIEVINADMRSFSLSRTFDFVLCSFMTFNYLMSIEDQLAFLMAVKNHLASRGVFVLELMTLATLPELVANDGVPRKVFFRNDSAGRRSVEMVRFVRFDSAKQIVEQDRHYRTYGENGLLLREQCVTWRNRFLLFGELQLLLRQCGLVVEDVYGDHAFGGYCHDSEFLVAKVVHG